MFAGWTITGYELNTAQTGTSENNLATLTEAVAETVGTKNRYFKNLTSLDINEVADEKDATITFSAQWVEVPSNAYAKDIITPAMYGDKVNYNANGVSDWKIFLNDEQNVYLITGSLVPVRGMEFGNGIRQTSGDNNYAISASSSGVLVDWLNSEEYWKKYASGLVNVGASAFGSPTLEQFLLSYNKKYATIYTKEMEGNYYLSNKSDPLYNGENNLGDAYFLATSSRLGGGYMMRVEFSGRVVWESWYEGGEIGCRPIITLPSNLEMTWNTSNNAWDIDPDQLTGAITAQNYGDKVNYSANGENDWKIFLQEKDEVGEEHICIITSGNAIYDNIPNVSGLTKSSGSSPYYSIWGTSAKDLETALRTPTNWTVYGKDEYEGTIITGSPTYEQLLNSYNAKYKTNLSGMVKLPGSDPLYGSPINWLATVFDGERVWNMGGEWDLYGFEYNGDGRGIRPLVRLPSNVKMRWSDSAWTLSN